MDCMSKIEMSENMDVTFTPAEGLENTVAGMAEKKRQAPKKTVRRVTESEKRTGREDKSASPDGSSVAPDEVTAKELANSSNTSGKKQKMLVEAKNANKKTARTKSAGRGRNTVAAGKNVSGGESELDDVFRFVTSGDYDRLSDTGDDTGAGKNDPVQKQKKAKRELTAEDDAPKLH